MSRMLEALKALERRQRREHQDERSPAATDWHPAGSRAATLDAPLEVPEDDLLPAPAPQAQPSARMQTCVLPTAAHLAESYLEMAARIGDQQALNYCSVLLFVAADCFVESGFSMTHAAQAFSLQSTGDVLLVDGDLRSGRLSESVGCPGPGMVEAMLGQAAWPDIMHPTNVARIDFVARGNAQVPTVERPNFGWGALRPLYRVVLIGLAVQAEPETAWLAARCDAVYLLISRPHTRRGLATSAINALRACGANVAGSIVVND